MVIVYYESHCAGEKPSDVDLTSSPTTVYMRRNFTAETVEEVDGWLYEEAALTRSDYAAYLAEVNAANIEYVAMMTDVELD